MAGGMQRGAGWGENLAARTARMREAQAASGPRSGDDSGQRGHPFPKHVWVTVTGITADQHPGILLDWRRDQTGGWEALVVWAAGGGRHAAHARIDWLAAHHVMPR